MYYIILTLLFERMRITVRYAAAETSSYETEISVIVVVYNSDLHKLYETLDSIIMQKGISYEVIICDDGSERPLKNELKEYFRVKEFSLYSLIFHETNMGTVANFYSGLEKAKGRYSKVISPGDYFADEYTLRDWALFIKEKNTDWAFSDMYYYHMENGQNTVFRTVNRPQLIKPYLKNDKNRCRWNYTVFWDIAIGPAVLGTTAIQLHYCKILKDKGVLYCEDLLWLLAMFYGNVGYYYPKPSIYYECGTGISKRPDPAWKLKLAEDVKRTKEILYDEKNPSNLQKAIVKALKRTTRIEKLFIRGKLFHWMKRRFRPRLTPIPEELCKHNENT